MTSKYVDLFHLKKRLPTFCHGSLDNFEGMIGFALWIRCLQHSSQLLTNSSNRLTVLATKLIY